MAIHKERHRRERLIPCELCGDFKGYRIGNVNAHQISDHPRRNRRRHEVTIHPFTCGSCRVSFSNEDSLAVHKIRHTKQKPFSCAVEGCRKRLASLGDLNKHKKTHTIEGQIRRKKQEHRLNTLLKEWGYTVDCETTINAKSGQCLTDTQKHFSRLDFRVLE